MHIVIVALILLSISGCASFRDTPTVPFEVRDPAAGREFSGDEMLPREVPRSIASADAVKEFGARQIELTYDNHQSGASVEIRATARNTYLLAQLATNAYDEDDSFKLIDVEGPFRPETSWTGFDARYFKVKSSKGSFRCVIAFRGTDFLYPNDWIFGNLLNTQYGQGLNYFDELQKSGECRGEEGEGLPIAVVGHSLGGAIATYISLRRQSAPSFVFNTSPRLTRGSAIQNDRIAVSQYAEVLAAFRHVFILAGGTYTTINCKNGGPIGRHSIRPLAECLTAIAASDVARENPQDPAVVSALANSVEYEGRILRGPVSVSGGPAIDGSQEVASRAR